MRLRRETGDFSIVITNSAATIPANLQAEQLVGQIITNGTTDYVVTAVTKGDGTYTLGTADAAHVYTYIVATGAIAVTNA